MNEHCINCSHCPSRLEGKGLFAHLTDAGLHMLDDCRTHRTYAAGRSLFLEGDQPSGLFCLHDGLVKLVKTSKDGQEGFLRLARPGHPLGYRALFIDGSYQHSAVTLTESRICYLPKETLEQLTKKEPQLGLSLVKTLSEDLTRAENLWMELAQKPVLQRVARLLLELESAPDWPPRIEMAQMLSISPESFARALSSLHKDGYLKRTRTDITLLDRDALAELAED